MQAIFDPMRHAAGMVRTVRRAGATPWARVMAHGPQRGDINVDMMSQSPNYLETLNVMGTLPFQLPQSSWLRWGIGATPMVKVNKRIHAKLEGESPGGSLKDRTITSLVLNAFADGRLQMKGDTLLLVTSGSAGYSLVKVKQALEAVRELELDVVVAMPKAYAHKVTPAAIIGLEGVTTFEGSEAMMADMETGRKGQARVLLLDGVFMEVLQESKELATKNGWMVVDQHYDAHAVTGHKSTSEEIMRQCPNVTDVVCATGTGATAAGLMKYLPDDVKVHSRPAVSGSIDGLSNMDRYDNFCDQTLLQGYDNGFFCQEEAQTQTDALRNELGVDCGPSTGATYWLAQDIIKKNPEATVVFICADGKVAKKPQEFASPTKVATQKYNLMGSPYPFLETDREPDFNRSVLGRKDLFGLARQSMQAAPPQPVCV